MHTCTDVITLKDVSNSLNGEWEAGEGSVGGGGGGGGVRAAGRQEAGQHLY